MNKLNEITIDAVPHKSPITVDEDEGHKYKIEGVLSEFTSEDYKSAFFLLIDLISVEVFFTLTNKEIPYLKKAFIELYHKRLDESVLVELLGVLKMCKKLRMLGTCSHVYESKEKYYNRIHRFWKMLYALCEEVTDDVLNILKQSVEPDMQDKILSAEDWFCWAFKNNHFSKTDVRYLEEMFREFPQCVNILKSYKAVGKYDIRLPTAESDCGIALIFNYEKFNNTGLENRKYSHKDVESLRDLWDAFGFQVEILSNLTYEETFQQMEKYGRLNYSEYDIFVCCILSHGVKDCIYSSDGELMEITELITPIVNCIGLHRKPKLFFIQACQGQNIPEGVGKTVYRIPTANVKPAKKRYSLPLPVLEDTLKVNSSIDGFVSFIDIDGSWFIQSLCKQMMQDEGKSSIEEVMTMVQEHVRNNYTVKLNPLVQSGTIQIVNPNEYFDDIEQNNDPKAKQIVLRQSTLEKKLFLSKRSSPKAI